MALFRSSLIWLTWRRASCLWRSTGSVYSSLPFGLSLRSWILRASWNLIPLRAKISSSSLSCIRGSTSCRKVLTSTPEGWPSGVSICQPRRKLPITMAFCRRLARVSALLQTPPESLEGSPGLFESPSEEVVGQTAPRLPSSPGPSTWERGVKVDIFLETGA